MRILLLVLVSMLILILALVLILVLILILILILVPVFVFVPILIFMLPEHARSALFKKNQTMGAFCLCRGRTRQQNAPIYNRAVLSFDDLFASFGIPTSTDAHPRAAARARR